LSDSPEGDRITSITVDGAPIDLARGYRIGSFNFLLQGGDNFREFNNGTGTRDSGLVDRDAWISYLRTNSPIAPSFERRAVAVTGVPTEELAAGATGSVTLSKLDLTSLGSPVNTEVTAAFENSAAAPVVVPVVSGTATVPFTIPADVEGDVTLVVTATVSGTVVRIPLTVAAIVMPPVDPTPVPTDPVPTDPTVPAPGSAEPVAADPSSLTPALAGEIAVSDSSVVSGQIVTVTVGAQYAGQYVSVALYSATGVSLSQWLLVAADGTVSYSLPSDLAAGSYRLAVQDSSGAVIGWTTVSVAGATTTAAQLAVTGTDAAPTLAAGALLLLLGAALVATRRRNRGAQLS
jgi:LPXTG-motif cell wall-anchored protein